MMTSRTTWALVPLFAAVLAGCDAGDNGFEGVGTVVAVSGSASSYAYARYSRPEPVNEDCPAPVDFGLCTFVDCYFSPDEQKVSVPVGPITILGGAREITLEPEGYDSPEEPEALFTGDEMLTFEVAGSDDVAPHVAEVRAPVPVTITAPLFGEPIEIDRSEDLTVSWTGGAGAYMQISLTTTTEGRSAGELHRVAFSCRVNNEAQEVAISTDLLKFMPAITDPANAILTVGPWSWNAGVVGGWSYFFYATASEATGVTIQ